jgi:hypothetical protein
MVQFDAQEIAVIIDGERVALVDSIGYDQSKDHELERSLDPDGTVRIIGTGEYSGSIAVKAVSESIPTLEDLFQNNTEFTLSVSYTESEPRDKSDFIRVALNEWGPADDYEESSMPMYEGSWDATRVEHVN